MTMHARSGSMPGYDTEKIPLDRFGRVHYLDHDVAF